MADINVERKPGGPSPLMWILGLLLLGLLVWGIMSMMRRDEPEVVPAGDSIMTVPDTTPVTGAVPPAVAPMGMDSAAPGIVGNDTAALPMDSAGGDTVAEGAAGTP